WPGRPPGRTASGTATPTAPAGSRRRARAGSASGAGGDTPSCRDRRRSSYRACRRSPWDERQRSSLRRELGQLGLQVLHRGLSILLAGEAGVGGLLDRLGHLAVLDDRGPAGARVDRVFELGQEREGVEHLLVLVDGGVRRRLGGGETPALLLGGIDHEGDEVDGGALVLREGAHTEVQTAERRAAGTIDPGHHAGDHLPVDLRGAVLGLAESPHVRPVLQEGEAAVLVRRAGLLLLVGQRLLRDEPLVEAVTDGL